MTMDPTEPLTPATPANSVVAVAPRAKGGNVLNALLIGAALVAVAGVAFAIGRTTAPADAFPGVGQLTQGGGLVVRADGSFAPGAGGPGGFALSGAFAMDGTVKSIDADSVTITLESGDEVTFLLDPTTTYHEATDADASDVAVGDEVSVKAAAGSRASLGGDGKPQDLTAGDITVAR